VISLIILYIDPATAEAVQHVCTYEYALSMHFSGMSGVKLFFIIYLLSAWVFGACLLWVAGKIRTRLGLVKSSSEDGEVKVSYIARCLRHLGFLLYGLAYTSLGIYSMNTEIRILSPVSAGFVSLGMFVFTVYYPALFGNQTSKTHAE